MNIPILAQFAEKQKTMSSREIAELSGKQHGHVCRDVEALNATYEKMGLSKIGEGYYTHPNTGSQQHREFLLTKEQCIDLVTGYNAELRIKINRRWAELENQSPVNLPDYPTALRLYADQLEITARIEQERDHAIATKAEIGSRREATAMSTASKYKRKAEKLEAEDANYGSVNSYHKDAWLAVYNINISVLRGGVA